MGAFDQPASAMNPIEQRIADSFQKQGLMTTLGAELVLVREGEVHIESALKIPQPVDMSKVFPVHGVQNLLENVLRRFDSLQISTVFRR